jgi:hypothetical protein
MKDWEEIISEAKSRDERDAERQRRLKIAKTALKGSAALGKGTSQKKGDKKDSRYLDYLERRQATREQEIEKQRKQEEENKKQKLVRQKEKNLQASKERIKSAIQGVKSQEIGAEEGGATATMKALGNLGSLAGGLTKAAINTPGYLKAKKEYKKALETKFTSNQPEKPRERKKPGRIPAPKTSEPKSQETVSSESNPEQKRLLPATKRLVPATKRLPPSGGVPESSAGQKAKTLGQRARKNPKIKAGLIQQRMAEEYSNWREEFLFEIDELKNDKSSKKENKKDKIDVMKGTNSKVIEINPNISEDHKEIESGKRKDDEGYMANVELDQMERAIKALRKKIKKSDMQMPAWVQSKITKAADYIDTASEYLQSDEGLDESYEDEMFRQHSKSELNLPSNSSSSATKSFLKRMKELNMNSDKPKKKKKKKLVAEEIGSEDDKKKILAMLILKKAVSDKKRKNFQLNSGIIGEEKTAAWQRKEGKNPKGGLNKKGIESYRRENPGSKLSMAVTTPPSKLNPDSKAAKRRKSFCARMGGMPGPMKDEKGRPTRKALSLRKWNC